MINFDISALSYLSVLSTYELYVTPDLEYSWSLLFDICWDIDDCSSYFCLGIGDSHSC